MTALVLTFLASFVGVGLILREVRRYAFRPEWAIAGLFLVWLGACGLVFLLIHWAVS